MSILRLQLHSRMKFGKEVWWESGEHGWVVYKQAIERNLR